MQTHYSPTNAAEAAHTAGYEANFDGALLRHNPHPVGSDEHRAWEAGHMQAATTRSEWEQCNRESALAFGEA